MNNERKGAFKLTLLHHWWQQIGEIGLSPEMPAYQYRRGYAYNQMNFTGLCLSATRFSYLLFSSHSYPVWDLFVNALPVIFCILMGAWMAFRVYSMTKLFSFILFPLLLLYISIDVHDRGVIAYFIPYLIYPFFFLHNPKKILITFGVAAVCFCASFTIEVFHLFNPRHEHNPPLELISFSGSLMLVFISLYAIKFQVWMYERTIMKQTSELEVRNASIRRQHSIMSLQKEKLEESNRTKAKLFSIISHDLRVPLRGLQLLFASGVNPKESLAKLEENLPELRAELKKTASLFENLLNWAKIQMQETVILEEPVALQDLVFQQTEMLHQKAGRKGVCIDVDVSPDPLYSDRNILEIVLRNLLSNAIKFSRQGGSIFIRGRRSEARSEARSEGQYLLEVEDQGIGIDGPSLQKIQRKSFHTSLGTKNEKGTGLGLIICTDLIEKCGGSLVIDSEEGKGTTVRIVLPQRSVANLPAPTDDSFGKQTGLTGLAAPGEVLTGEIPLSSDTEIDDNDLWRWGSQGEPRMG
jgi:two-component system, sensor histidine kinase and response regulator